MSDNIQVFVKMTNAKTATFQVTKQTTVKDFMQMIIDREGAEGVRLIWGSKTINEDTKDSLTLDDFGIYNEATLHAALRLKGGAQLPSEGASNAKVFDKNEVIKRGALVVTNNCPLYMSDGCGESNIPKAKLKCGCIYCSDCFREYLTRTFNNHLIIKIQCGSSDCGDTDVDPPLAFAIAAYTNAEKSEKYALLSNNLFQRSDSTVSKCPKCTRLIIKQGSSSKQACAFCKMSMCWTCKKSWKSNNNVSCGNEHCDPIWHITGLLAQARYKTIAGVNVIDTRVCKKCFGVNVHETACKHMTCKNCSNQYCHICMKAWGNDSTQCNNGKTCAAVGIQTITPDMVNNTN